MSISAVTVLYALSIVTICHTNTIQPHLMACKLFKLDINPRLIFWIVNFLVNHSDSSPPRYTFVFPLYFHWLSTRRCPTSYSFYTLYKWLHWPLHTTPIIKYSNDSAVEDPSKSDSVYFAEVERFSNWFRDNSHDLNVRKQRKCWLLSEKRQLFPTVFILVMSR